MADQLPNADLAALAGVGAITGMSGIALIAEDMARLAATSAAQMGGGSYKFQPAELQSVLNQWTDLQHTISQAEFALLNAPKTGSALAPGNEQASDTVGAAAASSNKAYLTYLQSMNTYVSGYVEKLSTALKNYMDTEHDQTSGINAKQGHLA